MMLFSENFNVFNQGSGLTNVTERQTDRITMAILRYAMAEPIKMPFGLCTRIGPGKHVLHGSATGRIRLNRPYAALLSNYLDHLFLLAVHFFHTAN